MSDIKDWNYDQIHIRTFVKLGLAAFPQMSSGLMGEEECEE